MPKKSRGIKKKSQKPTPLFTPFEPQSRRKTPRRKVPSKSPLDLPQPQNPPLPLAPAVQHPNHDQDTTTTTPP